MKTLLQRTWARLPLFAWGAAVLLALGNLAFSPKPGESNAPKPTPVSLAMDSRPLERASRFPVSFAPVVKKVSPSVVKVFTSSRPRMGAAWGFPDQPFLRRFFGDDAAGRGQRPDAHLPRLHGAGSGVIVSQDGYILTNGHVVDGAEEVKVTLNDGRDFTAKVVGTDPKTDVALLKVAAKGLPFIELADSDKIEVGDLVLAVGNPFGIGQTVTMGMVSATGRAHMGLDYEDFIQTDAAINPGNSGGALVDAQGRLIGINTAILSRSGGSQGIGFAIPTNLARYVLESITRDGRVIRGYAGAWIQDVTATLAKQFALKDKSGVLVAEVAPKGPAEQAGLRSGDVVVSYNGKPVRDARHFRLVVAETKPGDQAVLGVLRDGARKTFEVKLKELPDEPRQAKLEPGATQSTDTLHGVAVSDLDARARRGVGLPAQLQGVLVSEVEEDSAAFEAGLRPGDVILDINRRPVRTAEQAVKLTEHPDERTTLLRVWSKGGTHFLVVDETQNG